MQRRAFIAGIAVTTTLAACDASQLARPSPRGTLIVVRHTERTGENLNAAGIARAAALPHYLAEVEIDGIYLPDMQRNIDTAAPLAAAKGLAPQVIPAVDVARAMLRRQPGATLVWVGNKDNIAALWKEIGATGEPPLGYGEIAFVSMIGLNAGAVRRGRFRALGYSV